MSGAQQQHVLSGNGPDIAYDVAGDEHGRPLVLLHGLSANSTSWAPVIERTATGWRTYALDFRGHGQSEHTPGRYRLADYVDDAERLLQLIGEPAVVIGHSLGAIVAASLAQDRHPLVAAVFLEDPPLYLVEPRFDGTGLARGFSVLREHIERLQAEKRRSRPTGICSPRRRTRPATASATTFTTTPSGHGPGRSPRPTPPPSPPCWTARRSPATTPIGRCTAPRWSCEPTRPTTPPSAPTTTAGCTARHPTSTLSPCRAPATTSVATERPETATSTSLPTSSPTNPSRPWSSDHDHHPTITEHVLTLADGRRLRYARRGTDAPVTVVFVHGWPDSWRSFQPVLDALPPTVGAISISLRGFGGSDAPPDGYTPDDFAADVHDLVEHLGVTSAVFVGHSMGTLVVQRLAASHPEVVAGLVLIGGLNRLPDDVFDEVWSVVQDLADPISEQFVREFQSSTLAAPVPDGFFDQLVAESLKAPARVWQAAFAGIRTMPPPDTTITAPTLLLWGDQDALVPRSEQDALLSAIPDARLVVYEGAGHSPNWGQPERVADDIDAFLRSAVEPAGST